MLRVSCWQLAAGAFVREAKDVILVGPPRAGKSHIAQAIGKATIKMGQTVLYRSIFDTVRDMLMTKPSMVKIK